MGLKSESSSNLPWLDDRRYDRCSHASRTSSFPEGCVSLRPLTPRASAPADARTAVWRDVGGLVAYCRRLWALALQLLRRLRSLRPRLHDQVVGDVVLVDVADVGHRLRPDLLGG